ncbi:MAG: sugar phosphate nucleotidyltransferase [Thermoplasmata archaeon]
MRGIVTLAGDGSRMLPWARGLRKEFLPLFDRPSDGEAAAPVLKPVTHLVVETLLAARVTDLTLVVRPENRGFVQGYFRVDRELIARHAHHPERIAEMRRFDRALERLAITLRAQPRPAGFGDAVLRGSRDAGRGPFVVHAGDGVLIEPERGRLLRAMIALRDAEDLDAVLLVRPVRDPRRYGVVEGSRRPPVGGIGRLAVRGIEEKPARPRSPWAATAVYVFGPALWPALRAEARTRPTELELTSGIARLLRAGGRAEALVLTPRLGRWRSVGSPEGYVRALLETRRAARSHGPPPVHRR